MIGDDDVAYSSDDGCVGVSEQIAVDGPSQVLNRSFHVQSRAAFRAKIVPESSLLAVHQADIIDATVQPFVRERQALLDQVVEDVFRNCVLNAHHEAAVAIGYRVNWSLWLPRDCDDHHAADVEKNSRNKKRA